METALRPADLDRPAAAVAADAESFLATLRREQTRFLDAVAGAAAWLGDGSSQLAHVAAIQARLTRQFFDAQRSLLRRRAEVDADVARITADADVAAVSRTVAARRQVAAGDTAALPFPELATPVVQGDGRGGVRHQLLALGASVVRSTADAEELAQVIDDAFAPFEPDGAVAERQLAALLDEWWQAERREGRAVIDDAHASAAMRLHLAAVEANEIVTTAVDEPRVSAATGVADALANALDGADVAELGSLLDTLAESLQAVAVTLEPPPSDPDVLIRLDGPRVLPTNDLAHDDPFRRFWEDGRAEHAQPPAWKWLPAQVVLPMAAVTSVLALLLAWVG